MSSRIQEAGREEASRRPRELSHADSKVLIELADALDRADRDPATLSITMTDELARQISADLRRVAGS